ncbi:OSJNBb0028M18.1-like protein [Zea mays]|uniref:OSJNBb0028M18.1-like protein n=2 Tax=Zea mays TaxID=4577 RepID=A0A1D6IWS1_MAIZE|nr:OSJNBb0028M18.1-like protein [Zea mays]
MVMHGGSMEELLPASAGSVIEDSLEKEQNDTSEEEGKYLAVSKEGAENEVLQFQLADDEIREDKDNQTEARKGNTANTLQCDLLDSALGLEEKHGDEDASKSQTSNSDRIGFFIPVMSFMGHNGEEGINSTPTKGHISEVDPSEVSGTTSPKLPSNSEEVHVAEEKLDSSTETPASKVGDAESSEVSQSTGHPSTVEDIQVHQVSKHPGPSDEVEPNQLRGSVGDLPEGSASSATTKIHQSGDTETRESIHTRMGLEDTSDRNILQAQLAESALEPAEPEESLAIEEVLVTTSNEADKESAAVIEAVPALCETTGPKEAAATEKAVKEVDNIVKSLDEFTFEEGESKEMQKKQPQDYVSVDIVDNRLLPHLPHGFSQNSEQYKVEQSPQIICEQGSTHPGQYDEDTSLSLTDIHMGVSFQNLLIQRHHLDFYSPINVIFEAYAAKFDSSSGSFAQRNSKLLKETVNMQPEQADYYVVRNHIVVLWCSSPCTNADEYHAIVVAADFGDIVFNQFLDKVCRLRQVVVDVAPHGVEVTLGMALAAFRAARGVAAKHEAKLFLDWHLENLVYAIAASLTDLSMALWGSV